MPPEDPPTISGVSTAVTAFIGRTASGPIETPTVVTSQAQFTSLFGALSAECPLTLSVPQFFANGGREALIIRLDNGGQPLVAANFIDPALEPQKRGVWTLEGAPQAALVVIPELAPGVDVPAAVWNAAIALAARQRALVLVDSPASWASAQDAIAGADSFVMRDSHAALYFPRVLVSDPMHPGQTLALGPSGSVAGIFARNDWERGVFKAPAGLEASLRGTIALSLQLGSSELDALNRAGVNTLRELPGGHRVVWGARTLAGADGLGSEWKYVNVRRLLIFIERSIVQGTQWVVFEPNNETLWQKLRGQVETFLLGLWRSGALQGTTPREAFFVHCGQDTMTQDDIDNGHVNIEIGVAPLRRAEFMVVRIGIENGAGSG